MPQVTTALATTAGAADLPIGTAPVNFTSVARFERDGDFSKAARVN